MDFLKYKTLTLGTAHGRGINMGNATMFTVTSQKIKALIVFLMKNVFLNIN